MEQKPADKGRPTGNPLASAEPWDLVADNYSVDMVTSMEPVARQALQLAALTPSARIVDVATGPGTLAILAAKGGAIVSAIDFSAAMIANLRRRTEELGLTLADVRVGGWSGFALR